MGSRYTTLKGQLGGSEVPWSYVVLLPATAAHGTRGGAGAHDVLQPDQATPSSRARPNVLSVASFEALGAAGADTDVGMGMGADIGADTGVASIMFTSGSTGQPKGIPYTHARWMDQVGLSKEVTRSQMYVSEARREYVWFSFQPLSHGLDRSAVWGTILGGGRVVFGSGDKARLMRELQVGNGYLLQPCDAI